MKRTELYMKLVNKKGTQEPIWEGRDLVAASKGQFLSSSLVNFNADFLWKLTIWNLTVNFGGQI